MAPQQDRQKVTLVTRSAGWSVGVLAAFAMLNKLWGARDPMLFRCSNTCTRRQVRRAPVDTAVAISQVARGWGRSAGIQLSCRLGSLDS